MEGWHPEGAWNRSNRDHQGAMTHSRALRRPGDLSGPRSECGSRSPVPVVVRALSAHLFQWLGEVLFQPASARLLPRSQWKNRAIQQIKHVPVIVRPTRPNTNTQDMVPSSHMRPLGSGMWRMWGAPVVFSCLGTDPEHMGLGVGLGGWRTPRNLQRLSDLIGPYRST